jgi:starch synthase
VKASPVLAGASRGDPWHPTSASGAAKHLFDALEERFPLSGRVNTELTRAQRAIVAAATIRPSRADWRERFYKNGLAFELQSRNSARLLSQLPRFDLAVQVYGLFQTRGAPYTAYLDTTAELSRRYWPEWSPFSARASRRADARERSLYHGASHLFGFTEEVAASLVNFYGVDERLVSVVGGGMNFDTLPVLDDRTRPSEDEALILFVGREWRRKGGDVLLEAFRRLRPTYPNASLAIVGTDVATPEPGVRVYGTLDRAEVAALYRRATLFALPSRYEPYGFVLSEAMAHGLPCIGSTAGGMSETIVDGVTGILVSPEDTDDLTSALARLLADPALARRMGAAGRDRVEHELRWSRVVDRMAEPLERAAAEAGRR